MLRRASRTGRAAPEKGKREVLKEESCAHGSARRELTGAKLELGEASKREIPVVAVSLVGKGFDLDAELLGCGFEGCVDIGEGLGPVDLGLTSAQQVQIRPDSD